MDWEPSDTPYGPQNNIFKRLPVSELGSDGSVTFSDGSRASQVDAVVFATGYNFSFPFLDASGIISVSDNRQAVCTRTCQKGSCMLVLQDYQNLIETSLASFTYC